LEGLRRPGSFAGPVKDACPSEDDASHHRDVVRATEVAYISLIGSYPQAIAQLNMAVGREAIP